MKLEEVLRRLDGLKGVLLMRENGNLYLLKGYTIREDGYVPHGMWPFKKDRRDVKYISEIELSTGYIYHFKPEDHRPSLTSMNTIIDDRNRYLHMLSALKKLGYTILKK